MERRRTQTNEVGRCAILLPALPPGPLALLEVGASAGLCLLLNRFCYDYAEARVGDSSSPIDVRSDEDAEWLLACVAPVAIMARTIAILIVALAISLDT